MQFVPEVLKVTNLTPKKPLQTRNQELCSPPALLCPLTSALAHAVQTRPCLCPWRIVLIFLCWHIKRQFWKNAHLMGTVGPEKLQKPGTWEREWASRWLSATERKSVWGTRGLGSPGYILSDVIVQSHQRQLSDTLLSLLVLTSP